MARRPPLPAGARVRGGPGAPGSLRRGDGEALMTALVPVVADLLAHPRPVLCVDTCDLLDIIQCVAEGKAGRLEHVRRLVESLIRWPYLVQIVVSYLVPVEWAQNQAAVIAEVERK